MSEELQPPDLNDMFVAGLPLRVAVEMEREIKRDPSDPAGWWKILRAVAAKFHGDNKDAESIH